MGFEYKITAKFTGKQITEIQYLFENDKTFDKKYEFNNKTFWDFRQPGNNGTMPNISIIFENDGIYICQYSSSYVWKDLDLLKTYIENENIEYEIIDYQD
ncbi:hypothetical protein NZD88_09530 [Chryseobacterium antibioticum]|uniref:Uncharacterized protein n=1 Tax=Chryseobacterium pyrolae TaxID=2987481 RepID=A0ABT2IGT6_9FLAO|nr:hypothetical protein [Chryseobacterium pyrolae]MCT2407777.1 hypothetical protein [Chryseobacterium pyrolae]